MDAPPTCRAILGEFRGWEAAHLSNGLVRVAAVPAIGGRLMAYDLGDTPYLFVDSDLAGKLFTAAENQGDGSMAAWKNYGGDKTWPAPQGWDGPDQWPGPPDAILDSGRYELADLAASDGEAYMRMVSPSGSPTGVQITRQASIRAGSSRLNLHLTFANLGQRPIRWSIWDVVQLRADRLGPDGRLAYEPACTVTAPVNPHSRFPQGFNVMFGDAANPQWCVDPGQGLFFGSYQFEIGKVGLDSRGGWIAFANTATGHAFAERFAVEPDGDYPDGGADVECWTVGRGRVASLSYDESSGPFLMETEILSPFRHMAPGASASFDIEWGACRCAGPILEVSGAGCTSRPLQVSREGERATVTGTFGVFDVGELELVWLDQDRAPVAREKLGAVTPLALVELERTLAVPLGFGALRLDVVAAAGERRPLAAARLPY
ncbi:MAG: hypothetical protein ACM30E_10190 [Nitrososphaerales archaeon]